MQWHMEKTRQNNSLKAHGFVWFSPYNLLLHNSVIVTINVVVNVNCLNYNIKYVSTSQSNILLFFRHHLLTTSCECDHSEPLRFSLEHSARNNISGFQFDMPERWVVEQGARCCLPALVAASALHSCRSLLDWQREFAWAASDSQTPSVEQLSVPDADPLYWQTNGLSILFQGTAI